MATKNSISSLIGYGGVKLIAEALNLSPGATSAALRRANPGNEAVKMAMRLAKKNGGLEAAQALAAFKEAQAA